MADAITDIQDGFFEKLDADPKLRAVYDSIVKAVATRDDLRISQLRYGTDHQYRDGVNYTFWVRVLQRKGKQSAFEGASVKMKRINQNGKYSSFFRPGATYVSMDRANHYADKRIKATAAGEEVLGYFEATESRRKADEQEKEKREQMEAQAARLNELLGVDEFYVGLPVRGWSDKVMGSFTMTQATKLIKALEAKG